MTQLAGKLLTKPDFFGGEGVPEWVSLVACLYAFTIGGGTGPMIPLLCPLSLPRCMMHDDLLSLPTPSCPNKV